MKLTQKQLKECLSYDPHTGDFVWLIKKSKGVSIGMLAGYTDKAGYRYIKINSVKFAAHRLAFLYMVGDVPNLCDHINRVRDDNRWVNLRHANNFENNQNTGIRKDNTSGFKGVSYNKGANKFIASINLKGKQIHIGSFTCKYHAFCEYVLASRRYFGEFSAV